MFLIIQIHGKIAHIVFIYNFILTYLLLRAAATQVLLEIIAFTNKNHVICGAELRL